MLMGWLAGQSVPRHLQGNRETIVDNCAEEKIALLILVANEVVNSIYRLQAVHDLLKNSDHLEDRQTPLSDALDDKDAWREAYELVARAVVTGEPVQGGDNDYRVQAVMKLLTDREDTMRLAVADQDGCIGALEARIKAFEKYGVGYALDKDLEAARARLVPLKKEWESSRNLLTAASCILMPPLTYPYTLKP